MLGLDIKRTPSKKKQIAVLETEVTKRDDLIVDIERRLTERDAAMLKVRADVAARVRIGHHPLDVINLTSKVRGEVESSLLVQYVGDKIVVTAARHLTDAEYNQLVDILGFKLNRT